MRKLPHLTLCFLVLTNALAQPVQQRNENEVEKRGVPSYQAVTFAEDKRTIFGLMLGGLFASATVGLIAMRSLDHHACMYVQQQEEAMQHKWDLNHPDGFIPAGGQLRPATFDCKKQERPFRPNLSYNPSNYY